MHKDINVNVSGPIQPASTYKTVVLKGNHSFASQVTEPNMKYVIKHNFDLGGGSVTIPEGCLLEFDGGSISNGTLVGQSTILIYNQPFNDILTATLEGTWRHESGVKADEEDITDLNGELKFKDKAYAPAQFSGLGRVYLRKNLVNNVNILTQDMFCKDGPNNTRVPNTNTVFIIQYDYDLNDPNGEHPITVPENCVLEFDGGSLSNGSLVFNNTDIVAGNYSIFKNITFSGSLFTTNLNVLWFDIKNDGTEDISSKLQSLVNSIEALRYSPQSIGSFGLAKTLFFPEGCYVINHTVTISRVTDYQAISIIGSNTGSTLFRVSSITELGENPVIFFNRTRYNRIKNITFLAGGNNNCTALKAWGYCHKLEVENIRVSGFNKGFDFQIQTSIIKNCIAEGCVICFSLGIYGTSLIDCYARTVEGERLNTGYEIRRGNYSSLINCAADKLYYGYVIKTAAQFTLDVCGAEVCEYGVYVDWDQTDEEPTAKANINSLSVSDVHKPIHIERTKGIVNINNQIGNLSSAFITFGENASRTKVFYNNCSSYLSNPSSSTRSDDVLPTDEYGLKKFRYYPYNGRWQRAKLGLFKTINNRTVDGTPFKIVGTVVARPNKYEQILLRIKLNPLLTNEATALDTPQEINVGFSTSNTSERTPIVYHTDNKNVTSITYSKTDNVFSYEITIPIDTYGYIGCFLEAELFSANPLEGGDTLDLVKVE